jgi:hypothetical protein
MEGGVTIPMFPSPSIFTYLWLCWLKLAIRWRTNWWEATRLNPSTPNVKEACSKGEWCPLRRSSFKRFADSVADSRFKRQKADMSL